MTPKAESFSIVLLGSWNPSIFTDTWTLHNLAENQESTAVVAFPINDPTAPRKISFEGINLFPGRKQLLLSPEISSLEGMLKCVDVAGKIVGLLVHTPISHCGINFGFEENNNLERIINVLNLVDKDDINAGDYTIEVSKISRKIRFAGNNILFLDIADTHEGAEIKFNFHYEIDSSDSCQRLLTVNKVTERYNRAISFSEDFYNLELEEIETDEA